MSNDGTGERKVALITGAGWWPDQSPGLGWALGAELAEAGYRVVLSDREIEPAERAAADLVDKGFTAEAAAIDVTDDGAVARAVDAAAARHGRLDAVVNAAALTLHRWGLKPFHEISAEQCQQEMAVTLVGALNISRAAIPHLLTQGAGNLIFVASVLADEPAPRQAIYGLCKAAL
ncbi:MAG: SDR family NAD(P)-dependent oxidoreductase, partial [Alphaproteobacteria bacterium]|nr:SDR family NAD(P)-dependent oxidoreductase [Alphaproteobacteria bacterium]